MCDCIFFSLQRNLHSSHLIRLISLICFSNYKNVNSFHKRLGTESRRTTTARVFKKLLSNAITKVCRVLEHASHMKTLSVLPSNRLCTFMMANAVAQLALVSNRGPSTTSLHISLKYSNCGLQLVYFLLLEYFKKSHFFMMELLLQANAKFSHNTM